MQHGLKQLTPGCCLAVDTADSVFCLFKTMLLSSGESTGKGRLGPSAVMVSHTRAAQIELNDGQRWLLLTLSYGNAQCAVFCTRSWGRKLTESMCNAQALCNIRQVGAT